MKRVPSATKNLVVLGVAREADRAASHLLSTTNTPSRRRDSTVPPCTGKTSSGLFRALPMAPHVSFILLFSNRRRLGNSPRARGRRNALHLISGRATSICLGIGARSYRTDDVTIRHEASAGTISPGSTGRLGRARHLSQRREWLLCAACQGTRPPRGRDRGRSFSNHRSG